MINRTIHRVPDQAFRRRVTCFDELAEWWYTSPTTALFCCVNGEEYEDARSFRNAVDDTKREMRQTYGIGGGDLRAELIDAGDRTNQSFVTGLAGYEPIRVTPVAVNLNLPMALTPSIEFNGRVGMVTAVDVPERGEGLDSEVNVVFTPALRDVSPAFCARMALAITSVVGVMVDTPDNRAVAERTYTRLCREANVRKNVALTNRPVVLRAYFEPTDSEVWASRAFRKPLFSRFVSPTRTGRTNV